MKNIKDLGEKEVIWCKTREDCEAIAELLHRNGFVWCDKDLYIEAKPWSHESIEDFCFYPYYGEWCWVEDYQNLKFAIYEAKDFLQETPKNISSQVKEELQDILKEWSKGKFQIPLNKIIRERLK